MERKKELIIILIFSCLNVGKGEAQIKDSTVFKELFKQFTMSRFNVRKYKTAIDSSYIKYRQSRVESFCLANPIEKFNETDIINSKLYNARLVLYGTSVNDGSLKVILYEEFQGGSVGETCDIYQISGLEITHLVSFFVPRTIKSISDLKSAIKSKRYTVVDSYLCKWFPFLLHRRDFRSGKKDTQLQYSNGVLLDKK